MPAAGDDPATRATWRELRGILDEELAQVPERPRAALVLCYLEGLTRDEAAARLGWSLGTLKRRLDEGRQSLRRRLERRGVGPLALATASLTGLAADVPPALAESAQRLTTPGAAPAAVAALADAGFSWPGLRGLAVVLGFGLLACGVVVSNQTADTPHEPRAAEPPARVDRTGDTLPAGAVARLGTLRFRHGRAETLAFSADGRAIVTAGHDGLIRFWDPVTGRRTAEQRLPGTTPSVVALSPDGRTLAFQNDPEFPALRLWDVSRGQAGPTLPVGENPGWLQVAFSPDGRSVATANHHNVRLFELASGQGRLLASRKFGTPWLTFSADGRRLLAWDYSWVISWDTTTGRELHRYRNHALAWRIAFTPDGQSLLTIRANNHGLMLLDAATGEPAAGWKLPDVAAVSLGFTPDGRTVVLGLKDRLLFWDPIAGRELRSLSGRTTRHLVFSPDGKLLAVLGNHALQRWDLETGQPLPAAGPALGHQGEIDSVAFAPDGKTVATVCGVDETVRLRDAATGAQRATIPVQEELTAQNLAFSPDGRLLYVGASPAVLVLDVNTGREVRRIPLADTDRGEPRQHLMRMCLSADGRALAAYCQVLDGRADGRQFTVWDATTGQRLVTRPHRDPGNYSVQISPDVRFLVRGKYIEDAASGRRFSMSAPEFPVLLVPMAVSPDGRLVAVALEEIKRSVNRQWVEPRGVQVWEALTGQPVLRLPTAEVGELDFSPDGRLLAVAGPDAVGFWEMPAGREIHCLPAPTRLRSSYGLAIASCLAFSPDGRRLVTGHIDTTALVWQLPPAPRRPGGSLTPGQLNACWTDLAADAARAYAATDALGADAGRAVPFLAARLRPVKPVPVERVREQIAELAADAADRRDAASRQLAEWAERAEPQLRAALAGPVSAEQRRRLEAVLARPGRPHAGEALRQLRAVAALERAGTPEARRLLTELAGGSECSFTREARAAAGRLSRQP